MRLQSRRGTVNKKIVQLLPANGIDVHDPDL
jgi:hypothetical protein